METARESLTVSCRAIIGDELAASQHLPWPALLARRGAADPLLEDARIPPRCASFQGEGSWWVPVPVPVPVSTRRVLRHPGRAGPGRAGSGPAGPRPGVGAGANWNQWSARTSPVGWPGWPRPRSDRRGP